MSNPHEHEIHYTVNDEPQTTTERELTASQILINAGIDTSSNYLVEVRGNGKEKVSYIDNPNEIIKLHENMRFISISTGPKPVSNIHGE